MDTLRIHLTADEYQADELLAGSKPITLPEPWEMECSHPLCYAWWDPEVGCYVAAGRATEREAQRWY